MPPPRALNPVDKLRKRHAILDAAQQLWLTQTDRISSMEALAQASGVAKGTLYLYFNSKEEVLLALHERDMDQFFDRLIERAQQPEPMTLPDMEAILLHEIQHSPTFLPLASVCFGLMERQIPMEAGIAFKLHITARLEEVVAALQPHFPTMTCIIMLQAYALLFGLWQLLQQNPLTQHLINQGIPLPCDLHLAQEHFPQLAGQAISILMRGLLTQSTQNND